MQQTDILGQYFEKKLSLSPSLPLPTVCACGKGHVATKGTCPFRGFAGKSQVVPKEVGI